MRTGLPSGYYSDLREYFQDVHDQPSILNQPTKAFPIGLGLYWRDARLKFFRLQEDDPQVILEFRPMSIQPSSFEDYAMVAFAVGHIFGSQVMKLPLLPFSLVRENRMSAMSDGLSSELWFMRDGQPEKLSAKDGFPKELSVTEEGLRYLGAAEDEIGEVREVWQSRLAKGSPAEILSQRFNLWKGTNEVVGLNTRELLRRFIVQKGM